MRDFCRFIGILPALGAAIALAGCLGVTTTADFSTHFAGGNGYVVFGHNQPSPAGRSNANKFMFGYGFEIDAKGRYIVAIRDRNASNMYEATFIRFLPTGAVDTSFGGGTGAVTPNGNNPSLAGGFAASNKNEAVMDSISWDAAGHYYLSFVSGQNGGACTSVIMRLNEDGSLDTSFGSGKGYFFTSSLGVTLAGGTVSCESIGLSYDASLNQLVGFGGSYDNSASEELATARYSLGGALDPSYGASGGYSLFNHNAIDCVGRNRPTGGGDDAFSRPTRDVAGNYYLAVRSPDFKAVAGPGGYVSFVAKFLSNGVFDASYGPYGSGVAQIPGHMMAGVTGTAYGTKSDLIVAGRLAMDSSGQVYQGAGSNNPANATEAYIVRWTTAGALDSAFGGTGVVVLNQGNAALSGIGTAGTKSEAFYSVAYDPNLGKVLAVGYSGTSTSARALIVRFNLNGTLDTSFGGAGYVIPVPADRPTESFAGSTGTSVLDVCTGAAVDYRGRYVLSCASKNSAGGYEPMILRLNPDGTFNL